jgi:glycosyltransferase involved in cell wall biosynthesis
MKWLIVEDALRDRKGHWLECVSTFVRELRALGDEVAVLCDKKAQGFVMEQTGARPVLPESIWHRMSDGAGALKRYLRVPGHAAATFFAMRKVFRGFNHNRARGQVRERATGGWPEGRGSGIDRVKGHREHRVRQAEVSHSGTKNGLLRTDGSKHVQCSATETEPKEPATRHKLPATSSPPDWVFVPTMLVHHLLGWWLLLKTGSVPKESRVLLFFPNLPIRLDKSCKAHWTGGPTTKLMAWLFGQLKNQVESGRVVLGVETHAMRRALEGLIRMPVVYLPHPVQAKQAQGESRVEGRETSGTTKDTTPATSYPLPGTSAKPIIFGCYGAARWEKGSDIFQEAIKLILKNEVASGGCRVASARNQSAAGLSEPVTNYSLPATAAARPLRFCIQWVEDFRDGEGNLISIDPWLREHPQVEVIGRYFEGDEYERRLAQTDVMVLPYRKPYQLRVSRVVIEAMLNGMPVIATRGTTLFEQAEEYGVVVGCEEEDADSLVEAMLDVTARIAMLRQGAAEKVKAAKQSFSVEYFRKLISKQNDSKAHNETSSD